MDNYKIADQFSLLSKLMDIHGENSFKAKSYAIAAFNIEKLPVALTDIATEKIASLKGIGSSTAQKIIEILDSGKLLVLENLIKMTPPGVMEMLKIKGIGPKKIHTIYKEMELETIGELLYACEENRLKLYKGFGEKTQQQIKDSLQYYLQNKGWHLYASVQNVAEQMLLFMQKIFLPNRVFITGNFKQQNPVIETLDFVIETDMEQLFTQLQAVIEWNIIEKFEDHILVDSQMGLLLKFYAADSSEILEKLIKTSSSEAFYGLLQPHLAKIDLKYLITEEEVFQKAGLPFFPAAIREDEIDFEGFRKNMPVLIEPKDIKGIIHSHSNWSDGSQTIEEMALAAKEMGMEYLVMSDHSKSAFYAQGLHEDRIKAQHEYINELNEKLAPFKIFKSIESDILNDGRLDYEEEILGSFDLVIASVHSNLKMSEEKAMQRLLTAIKNPFTCVLGHPTGRLLLSRAGYPLHFQKIIEACAAHQVVIEINANPRRLDLDWTYIPLALKHQVLLSINPDAHSIEGMKDINYGVLAAQKGGLSAANNLSSYNLAEFEQYLLNRKKKLGSY